MCACSYVCACVCLCVCVKVNFTVISVSRLSNVLIFDKVLKFRKIQLYSLTLCSQLSSAFPPKNGAIAL